jgi:hypothetical protein
VARPGDVLGTTPSSSRLGPPRVRDGFLMSRGRVVWMLVAGLASAAAGYLASDVAATSPTAARTPNGLYASGAALGDGDLAFIAGNTLNILDAATNTVVQRRSRNGWTPSAPSYSPDGRWLAYTETRPGTEATEYVPNTQVWIARADGTAAFELLGLVEPLDGPARGDD